MPNGELDSVNQRVLDYFDTSSRNASPPAGRTSRIPRIFRARSVSGRGRSSPEIRIDHELRLRPPAEDSTLSLALDSRRPDAQSPRRDRQMVGSRWHRPDLDLGKSAEEAQRFLVEAGATLGGSNSTTGPPWRPLRRWPSRASPTGPEWTSSRTEAADARRRARRRAQGQARAQAQPPLSGDPDAAQGPPLRAPHRRERAIAGRSPGRKAVRAPRWTTSHPSAWSASLASKAIWEWRRRSPDERGRHLVCRGESGRRYGPADLALAEELARRASTAIESAQLYREAEERAQAARVPRPLPTARSSSSTAKESCASRNRAAEAITNLTRDEMLGHRAEEVLPGWQDLAPRVPVAGAPGPAMADHVPARAGRQRALALDLGSRLRRRNGLRVPRPHRGARTRADSGRTSSRPCRTSYARRSRPSTAPR